MAHNSAMCINLSNLSTPTANMTILGMYDCETQPMMNLELARIIQADREREIESELRTRRLLRKDDVGGARGPAKADRRPVQRPASTGATSR